MCAVPHAESQYPIMELQGVNNTPFRSRASRNNTQVRRCGARAVSRERNRLVGRIEKVHT
eukprot:6621315-Pyramimonas_sp.AAC.1